MEGEKLDDLVALVVDILNDYSVDECKPCTDCYPVASSD